MGDCDGDVGGCDGGVVFGERVGEVGGGKMQLVRAGSRPLKRHATSAPSPPARSAGTSHRLGLMREYEANSFSLHMTPG